MSTDKKSKLVEAIEKRARKQYHFRVSDFLGLPGPQVEHINFRVATKAEEDDAIVAAHRYVQEKAASTEAKADLDLLTDAKTSHILFEVCRDPNIENGHAFLSAQWMREHLTTDHLMCLLNLYNETRKKEGPHPSVVDSDTLDAHVALCVSAVEAEEPIPQWLLAAWNREALSEAFVGLSVKLDAVRKEADAAHDEIKSLRLRIAELESSKASADVAPVTVSE